MRTPLLPAALVIGSLGLAACGSSTPVRDHVQSARWTDACRQVIQNESTLEYPGDMHMYDVVGEVAPKSPAKVRLRALSAFEVEKETGLFSGSSLRLLPLERGHFPTMIDLAKTFPDDSFDQDWLVLEITLEVEPSSLAKVGIGSVKIEERSRAAKDPNQPWAPRWISGSPWSPWTPGGDKSVEDQLAAAFGLRRAPGHVLPSLWSLVDLAMLVPTLGMADLKTRGHRPLIGSWHFPGREPTPGEQAALKKVAGLLRMPDCSSVRPGGSCTQRLLYKRSGPGTVNKVSFTIAYLFGEGDSACALTDFHDVALPRGPSLSEQLGAVFDKGPVPLSSLADRERIFQTTGDDCEPGKPTCPPASECAASAACSLEGRCHAESGKCAATKADCENSETCLSLGRCAPKDGLCAAHPHAQEGCERDCALWGGCVKSGTSCWAEAPEHCAESLACKHFGQCQKQEYSCVAASSADCASSIACKERGFCTLEAQKCQAMTGADCARAEVCVKYGACQAEGGLCVAK